MNKKEREATPKWRHPRMIQIGRLLGNFVLGLVMAGTTCAVFGHLWWVFDLTCHFPQQYCLLLFPTALGFALLHCYRRSALSVILLATNLCVIFPLFQSAPNPNSAKKPMRILVLNVLRTNPDHAAVLELVSRNDPDVAVFLEVTSSWAAVLESLEGNYPWHMSSPQENSFGIAMFSRVQLSSMVLESLPGGGVDAIAATSSDGNGAIQIIGAHLLTPTSSARSELRNKQLDHLASLAALHDGKTVIVGDFNVTPWSPHFRDTLTQGQLRDARRGFGICNSYTALGLVSLPIDHCLVSNDVGVRQLWIEHVAGSDHEAVIVDLLISRQTTSLER